MNINELRKYVENVCQNSAYVFQNEEQFRYALAKALESKGQKVVVQKLEIDPISNKYIYVDIVVEANDGSYDFVELKYGKKNDLKNNLVCLSNASFIPNNGDRKKGFEADKTRLKGIVDAYNGKVRGFVVLLTNRNYRALTPLFEPLINNVKFNCYIEQI